MEPELVDKPFNSKEWVFEVRRDGVRSILLFHKSKGILELQSRNGKSITHRYPELIKAFRGSMTSSVIKCKESLVLDGVSSLCYQNVTQNQELKIDYAGPLTANLVPLTPAAII